MHRQLATIAALLALFLSSGCLRVVTPAVVDAIDQSAEVHEKNYESGCEAGDEQTGLAAGITRGSQEFLGKPKVAPGISPDALKKTAEELAADVSWLQRIKSAGLGILESVFGGGLVSKITAGAMALGAILETARRVRGKVRGLRETVARVREAGTLVSGSLQKLKHAAEEILGGGLRPESLGPLKEALLAAKTELGDATSPVFDEAWELYVAAKKKHAAAARPADG